MNYLTCMALSVGHGGIPVVEDIAFSVGPGDAVIVVGENGAGKSTLVKTLLGLLPPVGGSVSIWKGAEDGGMGYLPQRGESQRDFPASAWEVTLSGRAACLGLRPFYSRADRDAARGAMRRACAYELRDKPFASLSGGQQQRVLLARALASDPRLLVLDEPTTGLDPQAARSLWRTVDALREDGAGVIVVTHEVGAALPHATGVLEVAGGRAALASAAEWSGRGGAS